MKNLLKAFPLMVLVAISLFPSVILAQTIGNPSVSNDTKPTDPNFQLVTCRGVDDPRTSADDNLPDCDYNQLINTAKRVIQFVLYLLIPIVTGMILYVGFKYLTAGGDSGKIADAKRMVMPIVTGLFLIFAAWLLVYTLLDYLLVDNIGDVNKSDIVPGSILNQNR